MGCLLDLAVLAMFLANSLPISYSETREMSCHLKVTTKTTQLHPQVFLVKGSIIWQFYCTFDIIFHTLQNSSIFGQQ